jgi:hypothetical protein
MPSTCMPRPTPPHPEEAAQRPSRRTHARRAAAAVLGAGLLCLILTGCGSNGLDGLDIGFGGSGRNTGANDWIKPGAEPGETASAYSDCASVAQQATQKDADIDQDIAASRGADLQHSEIVQMRASQQHGVTTGDADSILASCMQQKGFAERH